MEARIEIDAAVGALGNSHAVMDRVRCSRRYQPDVRERARGPGIPFIDGISVAVELQRAIEVCALFDGTLSAVFDHAAPEDDAPGVVGSLKLEPHIESVDCASRKEMSNLACANDDVHSVRLPGSHYRFHTIERRR